MIGYRTGITYKDLEIAEENGISESNVKNRVYTLGWDVDKAITTPVYRKGTLKEIYGEEVCDNLKKNCILKETFYSRLRIGWSVKDASTIPPLTPKQRGKRMVEKYEKRGYKGGLLKEHFDIAKSNGISKLTVYNRVNTLRWDIEKAITEPVDHARSGYLTKLKAKGCTW